MPSPEHHRPTVRQLEYLVALADHLHFRKAAEASSVSQPALSAQIQTLEETLGVQLFERTRRSVLPTAAGREMAGRARHLLAELDLLSEAASSARQPLTGDLRLGVIPTLAPYLLPRILPGIRERYPELKLYLREEFTNVLLERLDGGELDLLLLALPVPGDYASLTLFRDPFLLAVPSSHELAARLTVTEADLDSREVLLLEDGHCLRDHALAVCGRAGARETARFRASSLQTLSQMVSGGLGITLLPEVALPVEARAGSGVEVRRFVEPQPFREVGFVWRKASARTPEYELLAEAVVELVDA